MSTTRFRRAIGDEADLLGNMTVEGLRHWGYHETFPELIEGLASQLPDGPEVAATPTFVLEEDGEIIGFYSLRDRGDHIELLQMFLDVGHIGEGHGRRLWEHAVDEAAKTHSRMVIRADPAACGFYEAMGATREGTSQVAPGFELGIFGYDLRS